MQEEKAEEEEAGDGKEEEGGWVDQTNKGGPPDLLGGAGAGPGRPGRGAGGCALLLTARLLLGEVDGTAAWCDAGAVGRCWPLGWTWRVRAVGQDGPYHRE